MNVDHIALFAAHLIGAEGLTENAAGAFVQLSQSALVGFSRLRRCSRRARQPRRRRTSRTQLLLPSLICGLPNADCRLRTRKRRKCR